MLLRPLIVKIFALLALVATVKSSAAQAGVGAFVGQYSFIGFDQISTNAGLPKIRQILSLPESGRFKDAVTLKIASEISVLLTSPPNRESGVVAMQFLVNELMKAQSAGKFWVNKSNGLGFALTVRVPSAARGRWKSELSRILSSQPVLMSVSGATGYEWRSAGNTVRLLEYKEWIFLSNDELQTTQAQSRIQQLSQQKGDTNLLEAKIEWGVLAHWVPSLRRLPIKLPQAKIEIRGKQEDLTTVINAHYSEPLGWCSKTWKIPLEQISDPVVSFVACQNIGVLLNPVEKLSQLSPNPLEEELFVWATSDVTFQTMVAMPIPLAEDVVKRFSTRLPRVFNPLLKDTHNGFIEWMQEERELRWKGLLMLIPYLKATKEKSGEFLVLGLIPLNKATQAAPKGLFHAINTKTNIIFYDWELTGTRLKQWRPLTVMLPILRPGRPDSKPTVKDPVLTSRKNVARRCREEWLTAVSPLLGNTVTEITCTGPNDVTLVRKSHIGFTGIELVLLTHWLVN